MVYSQIRVEHLQELCSFLLVLLEASIAEPGLFFHTIIFAFRAELGSTSIPCCATAFAFPVVMVRFAWRVEMVRVNIEDQIGTSPSLRVHRCRRFAIVSRGEVDMQRDQVPDSCQERGRIFESTVADHELSPKEQEPVLPLRRARRRVHLPIQVEAGLLESLSDDLFSWVHVLALFRSGFSLFSFSNSGGFFLFCRFCPVFCRPRESLVSWTSGRGD